MFVSQYFKGMITEYIKSLKIYMLCRYFNLFTRNLLKLFHTNSMIGLRPWEIYTSIYILLLTFCFWCYSNCQTFSKATIFKDSLIKLAAKQINLHFWLSSDRITSTHCKICQICQRKNLPQKIFEILLNQAGNIFNSWKVWFPVSVQHPSPKSRW